MKAKIYSTPINSRKNSNLRKPTPLNILSTTAKNLMTIVGNKGGDAGSKGKFINKEQEGTVIPRIYEDGGDAGSKGRFLNEKSIESL